MAKDQYGVVWWDGDWDTLKQSIQTVVREEIALERKHMAYHSAQSDIVGGVIGCPEGCEWLRDYDQSRAHLFHIWRMNNG